MSPTLNPFPLKRSSLQGSQGTDVPTTAVFVVGTAVDDHYVYCDEITLNNGHVIVRKGGTVQKIAYEDPPFAWGQKRTARGLASALHVLATEVRPGGGAVNTAMNLGRIVQERNLNLRLHLVDHLAPSPGLATACSLLGIGIISAGLAPCPRNLVLTQRRHPGRIVLKSPIPSSAMSQADYRSLHLSLKAALDSCPPQLGPVLIINSPKSLALARLASDTVRRRGGRQYSVLSGSLPPAQTQRLLLARDEVSLCNLEEFARLAAHAGFACPSDENDADVAAVADAVSTFTRNTPTGHLVITLGRRGCVVLDRRRGTMHHVHLQPAKSHLVQAWLGRDPQRCNGAGDRFAAAFVAAYELSGHARGNPLRAAVAASVEAVRDLAPLMAVRQGWFTARLIKKLSAASITAR